MAAIGAVLVREIFLPSLPLLSVRAYRAVIPSFGGPRQLVRSISYSSVRCTAASNSGGDGKKASARLSHVQQLMIEAEERALSASNEPIPRITLDHVTVNFARSGGPGGQNVNKVNTKVDMRFNVKNAYWLSDRVREKILQMEKNRINKDGEIVISSTKTRTQKLSSAPCSTYSFICELFCSTRFSNGKANLVTPLFFRGNIEDALEKLQAIIEAAFYIPPPPSEEQKKKIAKIAAIADQKRQQNKKILSQKKAFRRSRDSYD